MAVMKHSRLSCALFALALAAGGACTLAACTSDTESAREGAQAGEPVTKTIRAAKGGKVTTDGASVAIPAAALEDDTKITIEALEREGLPDLDRVASRVFDFGPDRTKFSEPVEIAIDFDAARTPKKMRAVLAYLDGDEWHLLDDTEVDDNRAIATTTHFTPYAVLFAPDVEAPVESCELDDFEACGGDLVGSWRFELGCLTLPD